VDTERDLDEGGAVAFPTAEDRAGRSALECWITSSLAPVNWIEPLSKNIQQEETERTEIFQFGLRSLCFLLLILCLGGYPLEPSSRTRC